ncbi:hypothetical protein KIPB_013070, partial [Kipferlia bialata]|eukprot:g13070.t1
MSVDVKRQWSAEKVSQALLSSAGAGGFVLDHQSRSDIYFFSEHFGEDSHLQVGVMPDEDNPLVVVYAQKPAAGPDSHGIIVLGIDQRSSGVRTIHPQWWRRLLHIPPSPQIAASTLMPELVARPCGPPAWKSVKSDQTRPFLQRYEDGEWMRSRRHKVGVLMQLPGQTEEKHMFGNRDATPRFDRFLALLGDRVNVKGFKGYGAGLDTRNARS